MTSYTISVVANNSDEVDALDIRFVNARRELLENRKKNKGAIDLLESAQRLILSDLDEVLPNAIKNSMTFSDCACGDEDFGEYLRKLSALIAELDLPGVNVRTDSD
ncbi:hypothetical protein BBC27_09690 [Acidithiobacillus ferrivorans]|uniref:Uncharacterized protein n=1 Tax=Acidithiobacillus ferrivorans TaxID=160808 RepID=A0A1B9BZI5_9PROT|nr:hypothetical protein [Acidithiobacillus ferrivorans]OCB03111.1 hypothetical protein BBC27_09690 [Acidithiobacillus ferrivorans]